MNKKPQSNLIPVAYGLVEADPKEIERRLNGAFTVLFDEMERRGLLTGNDLIKKGEIIGQNIKKEHEINTK